MPSLADQPGSLPVVAFRARVNAGTALPAGVPTKVNLQVEDFDSINCFSGSRFQPTTPGYYRVSGAVSAGASTTYLIAQIAKNGAVQANGVYTLFGGGNAGLVSVVDDVVYLNGSTDYVELFAQTGTAHTTDPTGTSTYFAGHIIR